MQYHKDYYWVTHITPKNKLYFEKKTKVRNIPNLHIFLQN